MRRTICLTLLTTALALAIPTAADAGPLWGHKKCPSPSYSPVHYWAPSMVRVKQHFLGPEYSVYPPNRYPEVPPSYRMQRYPCQPVDPAIIVDERMLP